MSHFSLMIQIPSTVMAESESKITDYIEQKLQPFICDLKTNKEKYKLGAWEIGGHWSLMLKLKDYDDCDISPIHLIDFDGIREHKRKLRAKGWDLAHQDGEPDELTKFKYGIVSETREAHIDEATGLTTHAVITKDGEWCETGEMMWGRTNRASEEEEEAWNDSFYENFIKPLDPHDGIAIIDCHV